MSQKNLNQYLRDYIIPVHTAVHVDQTIEEALEFLRQKRIEDEIIYIYVIDDQRKLIGVVPTRKLLLSDPKTPIGSIMETSIVTLKGSQNLFEALEFLETHRLLALPVVDDQGALLGVIDVGHYLEEKVSVASSRRRFEIFQLIGIYVEDGKKMSVWRGYRSRMPWVFCNLFGGFACAIISQVFEVVLAKVLLLAMFIPLVLTLSESISMQAMTQSMQLLKRHPNRLSHLISYLFREWRIIALLAVSCGIFVGAVSLFWGDGIAPALTIACGIMISVYVSATFGLAVPLILHFQKWDPRVASGPVVLAFADVLTTLVYLSLASWWLL
ncbi:MAG: magnesium transporter [Chlamydiota bacterium]